MGESQKIINQIESKLGIEFDENRIWLDDDGFVEYEINNKGLLIWKFQYADFEPEIVSHSILGLEIFLNGMLAE